MARTLVALVVLALIGVAGRGHAELRVQGVGKRQVLVRDQFPAALQPAFDVFARRCTRCHAMARPIAALQTGITPISGGTFETAGIKAYVVKMMRKPNSGIDKDEARMIIDLLRAARARAAAP